MHSKELRPAIPLASAPSSNVIIAGMNLRNRLLRRRPNAATYQGGYHGALHTRVFELPVIGFWRYRFESKLLQAGTGTSLRRDILVSECCQ